MIMVFVEGDRMNQHDSSSFERERFLTVREVAVLARLSERTIWNLIVRGTLPAVRRPGGLKATRIRRSDFEALMATSTSKRREVVA